jgi:hypothetical protein
LQYLLELSSDIRLAFLWNRDGELLGSAPAGSGGRAAELAGELVREAEADFPSGGGAGLELDAGCEGGAVFLMRNEDLTMLSVTERAVLPGLIFYDMHAVLRDLERAAQAELRRGAAAR